MDGKSRQERFLRMAEFTVCLDINNVAGENL